jgi:predicted protein tyrosine phosphatase
MSIRTYVSFIFLIREFSFKFRTGNSSSMAGKEAPHPRHILFVCTTNMHRSPTAEFMLAENANYEVRSAGISILSKQQVTQELVEWADIIFVMDERTEGQKSYLLKNFPMAEGLYLFGSQELVKILMERLEEYI